MDYWWYMREPKYQVGTLIYDSYVEAFYLILDKMYKPNPTHYSNQDIEKGNHYEWLYQIFFFDNMEYASCWESWIDSLEYEKAIEKHTI